MSESSDNNINTADISANADSALDNEAVIPAEQRAPDLSISEVVNENSEVAQCSSNVAINDILDLVRNFMQLTDPGRVYDLCQVYDFISNMHESPLELLKRQPRVAVQVLQTGILTRLAYLAFIHRDNAPLCFEVLQIMLYLVNEAFELELEKNQLTTLMMGHNAEHIALLVDLFLELPLDRDHWLTKDEQSSFEMIGDILTVFAENKVSILRFIESDIFCDRSLVLFTNSNIEVFRSLLFIWLESECEILRRHIFTSSCLALKQVLDNPPGPMDLCKLISELNSFCELANCAIKERYDDMCATGLMDTLTHQAEHFSARHWCLPPRSRMSLKQMEEQVKELARDVMYLDFMMHMGEIIQGLEALKNEWFSNNEDKDLVE